MFSTSTPFLPPPMATSKNNNNNNNNSLFHSHLQNIWDTPTKYLGQHYAINNSVLNKR